MWKDPDVVDTEDAWDFNANPPDFEAILEQGFWLEEPVDGEVSGYTARMYGLLVAPFTGQFWFRLSTSGQASVWFSETTDSADAEKYMFCDADDSFYGCVRRNNPVELVEGQHYFVGVLHHQEFESNTSIPAVNQLRLILVSEISSVTDDVTEWSDYEQQILYVKYNPKNEIQQIELIGDVPDTVRFSLAGASWNDFS